MNVATANYLLGLDKHIVIDGEIQSNFKMVISGPVELRWKLVSITDTDQEFLLDIKESKKKEFTISLHHQDDISKRGLLRIDYHSRHKNPVEISENVPEEFKPYAGIFLDEYPGHIHYNVEGYTSLAWAIPLQEDLFTVKDITNQADIGAAIKEFCNKINIRTNIEISAQLRILL